jgi:D-3-phosphoglycerate dehydrogenase
MKVLLTEAMHEDGINLLRKHFETQIAHTTEKEKLINIVKNFPPNAIITKLAKISKEIIESAPDLKIIAKHGIGYDNIDVNYAKERNIYVINVPHDNADSTSEFTITLILALLKKVTMADQEMKMGIFERNNFLGNEIMGKTLGIVGVGFIGRKVAEKLAGFGMRFVGYDPYVKEKIIKAGYAEIEMLDFDELLSQSDIITIHTPLTSHTKNLFNKSTFSKMKSNSWLINAARGGIVNELDLYESLKNGCIAGAALDVYESEPKPIDPNHPLLTLEDKIILTPHIAAYTKEAQRKIAITVAEDIIYGLKNGIPRNLVKEFR